MPLDMDGCDYLDNALVTTADARLVIDGGAGGIEARDEMDTPLLFENDCVTPRPSCLIADQGFHTVENERQSATAKRQLILAISLCFVFMIAEIVGGYFAGSLAIMADAAHLLTDCVSFIVALVAIWMSKRPPDQRMTFGYKRAEVIGAILSILGIWLLTAFLCYFSVTRLIQNNFDIDAVTMMAISAIGIVINIIMAFILHGSCCVSHGHTHGGHGHSHAGGHGHSHSPPTEPRSKFKRHSFTADDQNKIIGKDDYPSYITNGGSFPVARSDSICSYRSPSHSRTNSFSKTLPSNSNHHTALQMRLDEAATCTTGGHRHFNRSESMDSDIQLNGHSHNTDHSASLISDDTLDTSAKNINVQAAVIHVIGDFIQSVGVFIAAIVIYYYPDAKFVDPLCTFLFSIIVLFTTVRIMRQSFSIIMDAVPSDIDVQQLHNELVCMPGVRSVHHLTVFSVTVDWPVMAVHLVVDPTASSEKILKNATEMATVDFGIKHCTIQLEPAQPPSLAALHQHIDRNGDTMINFV